MVTSSRAQRRGWSARATAPVRVPAATSERKRWRLLGRPSLAHHRGELADRRQERSGGGAAAELLDDHRGLDEGEADAAVLLGDGRAPASRATPWTPRARWAPRRTRRRARTTPRVHSLSRKERTERTQLLLLARELEVHRAPFPALGPARRSCSRPAAGGSGRLRLYLTPLSAFAWCRPAQLSGRRRVSPGGRRSGRKPGR